MKGTYRDSDFYVRECLIMSLIFTSQIDLGKRAYKTLDLVKYSLKTMKRDTIVVELSVLRGPQQSLNSSKDRQVQSFDQHLKEFYCCMGFIVVRVDGSL